MGTDRDDELARTATAPVGSTGTQPLSPADPVGPTLGRYKLERELGAGGMGVVHAAFDPDLERRVALKVLRESAGSSEARQRLLREARAMARLSHPNVVTVHEVASANGRDYVAMEMIDGQSLAEWMRAERRPEDEIISAFVAAGRGLAAAHAEGIVHRDFKPHNILRHRNGRIAVTDFGLARDVETPLDPLAETRELRAPGTGTAVSTTTPSSPLAGLTMTGSVLGTPAYMAPEQWSGGAVTPATDQFAFCVALWEALAGERPFKGATVEKLREEVQGGPAQLDISKIPRRLRAALLRGLDPDPARRWPSMEALLAAMTGADRTSKGIYVVAGAAIAAGVAVLVAIKMFGGDPQIAAATACRAPQLLPDPNAVASLRKAGQGPAAEMIEADLRAWQSAREAACGREVVEREPQLACLDGVLARLDAVVRGVAALANKPHVDAGFFLVDPAVCAMNPPPRLTTTMTPQFGATMAALLLDQATPGRTPVDVGTKAIENAKGDPCAAVYARYLAIRSATSDQRERLVAEAQEEGERCSDDRVRAEIALVNAELALESGSLNTAITSKVKLAELAAQRVMQADVLGAMEMMRAEIARRADQID
ncbi:MAG: serine/threonine protein kinase, partial [Myxococcota bacterium]|nr:serine/threonine protein kinase [Myxococcota bacterium]